MTKYLLTRPGGPWDYPTLGFRAVDGAILDGSASSPVLTVPPDAYWAVYSGGSAETGITRTGVPSTSPTPETQNGYVLAYSDAANTYVPVSPASLGGGGGGGVTDAAVAAVVPSTLTAAALSSAYAPKAATYASGVAYVVGQLVVSGTTLYRVTTAHTSSGAIDLSKFATAGGGVPAGGTTGQTLVKNSGTDGDASWAASPASKFRDDIGAYNVSESSLRSFHFGYAKSCNNEGRCHIFVAGDSVSSGYRATAPVYLHNWPSHLKSRMDARTGVATGSGFIKPNVDEDPGENRLIYGGSWGNRGSGFFGADRYNNAGGTLTLTGNTDRITVYFLKYGGGGTATTTFDGVPAASINTNQGSFAIASVDYTATQGTHTLVITAPTGTDFVFLGAVLGQNGTTTGIQVDNAGYSGKTASGFYTAEDGSLSATAGQLAFDVLDPSLTFICFGLNELAAGGVGTATATYKANILRITQRAKASGSSVVLLVPPHPSDAFDPASRFGEYVLALYQIADAEDVIVLDLSKRWGSYATANAAGLMFDDQHPTDRGYWDLGNFVSTALLNVAVI